MDRPKAPGIWREPIVGGARDSQPAGALLSGGEHPVWPAAEGAAEQVNALRRIIELLGGADDLDATLAGAVALYLPHLGDLGYFDALLDQGEVRRVPAAGDEET